MIGARLFFLLTFPDPEHSSVARTLIALGYALAALLWWRAGSRPQNAKDSYWWRLGAGLLGLLTINKIFDLRIAVEDGLRAIVKELGWYDHRQPLQFAVAIVLPLMLVVAAAVLLRTEGMAFFRRHLAAAFGWLFLLSYHGFRQVVEWKPALAGVAAIGYFDWRILLEAGGIALVSFSALMPKRLTTGYRVSDGKG